MPRQRIHGEHSLVTKRHPTLRYADRIQLLRWRRGPNNPTWEARARLQDGTWTRPFSLGTTDEVTAALNAVEELTRREQLQASGLPQPTRIPKVIATPVTNTFGDAANTATERLIKLRDETLARDGRQKAHKYDQHISRIRNVLMPAFSDMAVQAISRSYLNDWMRAYRTPKNTRALQNTVGNYNHSFRFVMDVAVEREWIRADDVPSISKKGFEAGTERPWFTQEEIESLRNHMNDEWISKTHKGVSAETKYLLRAYIAVGSCTGIRPGLELERIRTNQILFERAKNVSVIRIPIARDQGKYKKSRDVFVYENDVFDVRSVLKDLIEWRENRGSTPDAYLFSRPSDRKVTTFSRPFKLLLKETGLLLDPETQQERVPYSLRHYFATQALLRGLPDYIVAKWMGTSPTMIDKHYNKVKTRMMAGTLSGTMDKIARARAIVRRKHTGIEVEPILEGDEYPPEEIVYGSHFIDDPSG
jgi:integrase